LDGLLKVINRDLVILYDTTNDELVDSVGNRFFLALSLPDKSVLLDCQNLLEQLVKVGLCLVWLDLEEDD
jgi:hypothetical protein